MAASMRVVQQGQGDVDEIKQKMKDNEEKIEQLRRKFFEEHSPDDPDSPFDPYDLEWVRTCDVYVFNTLLISKLNVDTAFAKLVKILKWRKEYGVNDLTFNSFPEKVQRMGALYEYKTDKKGHRILWYKVKYHQKDPESQMWAKKMTVYWLERLQKEDPESRITILEDMTGAGIANMDIDVVRFKISCFELYFPALVDMLYIYDMPWILNTLWKVVEKLLSQQARDHIKFIRGKEVQKYIDLDVLPVHMGGTDTYQWVYTPEEEAEDNEPEMDLTFKSMDGDNDLSLVSSLPLANGNASLRQPKQTKKVHFALDDNDVKENIDLEHHSSNPKKYRKPAKRFKSKEVHKGPLVSIRPGELLVFEPPSSISGSEGITASLTISNNTEKRIAYKVKTTTPDRYKVRPSAGPINPGSSIHITITLLSGPGEWVVRDKFLILSCDPGEVSFKTTNELTQFWKNVGLDDVVEHRMSCVFSPLKSAKGDAIDQVKKDVQSLLRKVTAMQDQMSVMQKQSSRLLWLVGTQFLGCLLMLVYFFYFTPPEGSIVVPSVESRQQACPTCFEATEKFLRGAREGL